MSTETQTAETYEAAVNGRYSEIVAIFADGRKATIDLQYGVILPHGDHNDNCAQLTQIGGRCNCGLLDGIDADAVIGRARAYRRQQADVVDVSAPVQTPPAKASGVCPRCHTYCNGDCRG